VSFVIDHLHRRPCDEAQVRAVVSEALKPITAETGSRHAERQSKQPRRLPGMRPDSAAPRPPAALLFDPLPQPGEEPEPQQESVSGACPPPLIGGEPPPPKKPRKINALQGAKSAPKTPQKRDFRLPNSDERVEQTKKDFGKACC